jgi:hypothetical protein
MEALLFSIINFAFSYRFFNLHFLSSLTFLGDRPWLMGVDPNCRGPYSFLTNPTRGVNVWGVGGWFTPPPQINDPVGLKLSAVGLKIMRLFTCGALRSKLNI